MSRKTGQGSSRRSDDKGQRVVTQRSGGTTLWAALLVGLTVVAYLPALRGGFIWDDDSYLTHNATVQDTAGLSRIWFDLRSNVQYYPLVFTTFWVEHQLWGLQPAGYHVVNVLLHALAVVLLWRVLGRLGLPGAWLAAAIFALHPVHVESVAWVTERKNVLSMVFYLLAAGSYLRFAGLSDGCSSTDGHLTLGRSYVLALVFFCCALLSKTAVVAFPVAAIIVIWLKRGRITKGEILALVPFLLASIVAGVVTSWVEREHVGADRVEWTLTLVQRFLLAGRALIFYLTKLIWPTHLAFVYDRWTIDAANWSLYLYPAAVAVALFALWTTRHRIGRGPIAAMLFFIVGIGPALGFVNFFFMNYSFVADHFQYVPSLGPIVFLAAAGTALAKRWATKAHRPSQIIARCVGGAILLALGVLTWQRCGVFHDKETLWFDVLAKSPSAQRMVHENLAVYYGELGRLDDSAHQYAEALRIKPDAPELRCNLGITLYRLGRLDEGAAELAEALRLRPAYPEAASNLGLVLMNKGRLDEAARQFQTALRLAPDFAEAHFNYARLLTRMGRNKEAVAEYQEVLRLNPADAEAVAELKRLNSQP